MSDPIPAISESEATGLIAEIYADIRRVYRVGVVNLIWRRRSRRSTPSEQDGLSHTFRHELQLPSYIPDN